jgi:phospholipase D
MKILIFFVLLAVNCAADTLFINTHYTVCFTPGGQCTDDIVNAIHDAKKSIYIQAYQLTSDPIIAEILAAKDRGVLVDVILDKSQLHAKKSALSQLQANHIPVLIDSDVAIAHNKVMIIDGKTVITGSFNFTKNAQNRNAENLLIIYDKNLASEYMLNWISRSNASHYNN